MKRVSRVASVAVGDFTLTVVLDLGIHVKKCLRVTLCTDCVIDLFEVVGPLVQFGRIHQLVGHFKLYINVARSGSRPALPHSCTPDSAGRINRAAAQWYLP